MAEILSDALAVAVATATLTSAEQTEVVVVISTVRGPAGRPVFPVAEVEERLAGRARVLVVPNDLTASISDVLGAEYRVFNGAARVFPVRAAGRPYTSRLFHRETRATLRQSTEALVNEALEAARALEDVNRAREAVGRPPGVSGGSVNTDSVVAVAGAATPVLTAAMASELAGHLLSPDRTRPVVMITVPAGAAAPLTDADRVADEVGQLAEVYVMPTSRAVSWAFADALADFPGTECYGGACRVYPPGLEWTTQLHRSPLRFVFSASDASRVADLLVSDALTMAYRSGAVVGPQRERRPVSGVVQGVVSGRGLVRVAGGGHATVWPELTAPDVEPGHLFVPGMRVEGPVDPDSGRMDVSAMTLSADTALTAYGPGSHVLARIAAVEADLCVVELFPDFQCTVPASSIVVAAVSVDLRQWLSEGEVVTAVVVARGATEDDWVLSLLDAESDAVPVEAPPVLRGGPPWLSPRPAPDVSDQAEDRPLTATMRPGRAADPAPAEVAVGAPAPAVQGLPVSAPREDPGASERLADMAAERDALAVQLTRQQGRLERYERDLNALKTRARQAQAELVKWRRRTEGLDDVLADREADLRAFADPLEQLRYEVDLAWARTVPASEKAAGPRRVWTTGPDFLRSLTGTPGVDRSKVVDVIVQIITDRVHGIAGRETHQLRSGSGGGDPYVTRPDGATCWRVALQRRTPQARRLHYWHLGDGSIELSGVRLHDDMRP